MKGDPTDADSMNKAYIEFMMSGGGSNSADTKAY